MLNYTIYSFTEYKQYLDKVLHRFGGSGHGVRSEWARVIGCHTTYISQIINKNAHLSLEQALKLSQFLNHTDAETHFFLLLVNYARAGTQELKTLLLKEILAMRGTQLTLRNQTKAPESLKGVKNPTYYSSWQFAAIHVALSLPSVKTDQDLSQYLGIPVHRVKQIIAKLADMDLVRINAKGKIEVLQNSVHLDRDSDELHRHHTHWRLQAIQALEREADDDLHYSSVITASYEDAPRIKAVLLEAIEKVRAIVRPSKDEAVFSYAIDFFTIGR